MAGRVPRGGRWHCRAGSASVRCDCSGKCSGTWSTTTTSRTRRHSSRRMIALSPRPEQDLYVLRARAWVSEHENDIAEVREATRRSLELGAGQIPEHAIDIAYTVSFIGECDEARAVLEPLIERCRHEGRSSIWRKRSARSRGSRASDAHCIGRGSCVGGRCVGGRGRASVRRVPVARPPGGRPRPGSEGTRSAGARGARARALTAGHAWRCACDRLVRDRDQRAHRGRIPQAIEAFETCRDASGKPRPGSRN